MIGMTAYLSDQRDALQKQLDTSVRDAQKLAAAIEDALGYLADDDPGLARDALEQALTP